MRQHNEGEKSKGGNQRSSAARELLAASADEARMKYQSTGEGSSPEKKKVRK